MSTELRTLLQNGATVPGEPDLADAFRRGRTMRARRRAAIGVVTVVLAATAAITAATITSDQHRVSIASKVTATPPAACPALSTKKDDIPSWAQSAHPPAKVPHLLARDRNVIAFIFGNPLQAGQPRHNRNNKILWIVREPRHGQPLQVSGTLVGGRASVTESPIPADARPGEIYPSTIDVPSPGCWHFVLHWNGHQANINLHYR